MTQRVAALLTHPIQYYSPWLGKLANRCDLEVFYAHRQSSHGQAEAGFGVAFEWDVPLLEGYRSRFLTNVSAAPGLGGFRGCDTPEIVEILRRERFDALILFGWNKKCLLQGWAGALRAGTCVFVRVDNQIDSQPSIWRRAIKRMIYPVFLSRSAHYLSPGRRTDQYLRTYCVPKRRIHRLPHMIDRQRFAHSAQSARQRGRHSEFRRRHGIAPNDFVFLFVGKLLPKKRPELLLDAFLNFRQPGARLLFAGDGPLRQQLQDRSAHDSRISFAGFINQSALPLVYAACNCIVLPSDSEETWGLVINEAQACGLPAIVSQEAGCAPELIDEGRTGWKLTHPNAEELTGLLGRAFAAQLANTAEIVAKSESCSFERGIDRMLELLRAHATSVSCKDHESTNAHF